MTTMAPARRLLIAVVMVAGWAAITIIGSLFQAGHGSLAALVSSQIMWASPAAALFLWVGARLLAWRDLGLEAPSPISSVRLFWLIGLYISAFGAMAALTKDITIRMLLVIAINTAFVGFSEELAFRGVLWGAARKAMSFWPGVMFVSAIFGGIHVLNAVITGHLGEAVVQALNAFLSGMAYLALRIRTRSLFPIMTAHWLWDLVVFLNSAGKSHEVASGTEPNLYAGAALVAPIALHGLWLLRKRELQWVTDERPDVPPQPRDANAASEVRR